MLKSNNIKKGFTIIEVIIVLVIAAIIMVMVFLVVPQLQQSQRNTKRQNYARQVLAAVNQFYANSPSGNLSQTEIENITSAQKDPTTNTTYTITFQNSGATLASLAQNNIKVAFANATCSTSGNDFASGSGYAVIIATEPFTTAGGATNGVKYCVTDAKI